MAPEPSSTGHAPAWTARTVRSIAEIGKADWDACAFPESLSQPVESPSQDADSTSQEDRRNPFISYDFLAALEASGCVGGRTGWTPCHIALSDRSGALAATVPCYLKSHSQGEYVFDHGWAEAFARAGGEYYPKLQIATPFTPVTGRRLLIRSGVDGGAASAALDAALRNLLDQAGASSIHATFLTQADADALVSRGWLLRHDRQFHWINDGYRSFDDFLAVLSSRKRKTIRRERSEALSPGVAVEWLTGADIREAHWDAFFAFYMDTGSRKWGRPYLNRRFFSLIGESMADRIALAIASRGGRMIAGAINFIGARTLYGRNWGAIEHHPFLHFEVCYYQAIDFAIARGLERVEAGAQGEHKLARGYMPATTRSAHFIAHPGLRRAVADYLDKERAHIAEVDRNLVEYGPFRKSSESGER